MAASDANIRIQQELGVEQGIIDRFPVEMTLGLIQSNGAVAMFLAGIRWLLSIVSLSSELLLRNNFGLRYLTLTSFVITLTAMSLFLSSFHGGIFFTVLVGIFGLYHLFIIKVSSHKGEMIHTRSSGDSLLLKLIPVLPEQLTRLIIEPALIVIMAVALPLDPVLYHWWLASALGMLLKESMAQDMLKKQYLDLMDNRIEASAIQELFSDKNWSEPGKLPTKRTVKSRGYPAQIPFMPRTEQQKQDTKNIFTQMFPKSFKG